MQRLLSYAAEPACIYCLCQAGPLAPQSCDLLADAARKNTGSDLVYVCEYRAGRLLHEEALSSQDLEVVFGPLQVSCW